MAVLYRIQKLVERESKEISILWKVFAIILCATTAIAAVISYIAQGKLYEGFGGACILESHIKFKEISHNSHTIKIYNEYDTFYEQETLHEADEQNDTSTFNNNSSNAQKVFQIDIAGSQWGPDTLCQFCQFVPAMSVVIGVFWATMFSACPRGGINRRGLRQSWRIVPVAFIFFLAIGIFSALASSRLKRGLAGFCAEFFPTTNSTSCSEKIDVFTAHFHEDNIARSVFKWIDTAIASIWLSTVCWILGAMLMLIRFFCLVDFQISITTVTSRSNNTTSSNTSENDNLLRKASLKSTLKGEMVTSV